MNRCKQLDESSSNMYYDCVIVQETVNRHIPYTVD